MRLGIRTHKSMYRRFIQFSITFLALGAALLYVYIPELKIDGVIVTLLGLAALPWIAPLFRSVEVPGLFRIEFRDLEEAKRKIEGSGLVKPKSKRDHPVKERHIYAYEAVAGSSPNMGKTGQARIGNLKNGFLARVSSLSRSRMGAIFAGTSPNAVSGCFLGSWAGNQILQASALLATVRKSVRFYWVGLRWTEHGMAGSDAAIPASLICFSRLSDPVSRPNELKHRPTK